MKVFRITDVGLSEQGSDSPQRRNSARHSIVAAILALVLASGFGLPSGGNQAMAHGGGLDSNGGHNCYVSACAGTYHCHQSRGPRCGGGSNQSAGTSTATRPPTTAPVKPGVALPRCVKTVGYGEYTRGEIGLIQSALRGFGYQPGPIDGIFGRMTRGALNAFERARGLSSSTSNTIFIASVVSLRISC